jgi:hypothetical protein
VIVEDSQRGPAPLSIIPWLKLEVFTGSAPWKMFHTVLAFDEIYRSLRGEHSRLYKCGFAYGL